MADVALDLSGNLTETTKMPISPDSSSMSFPMKLDLTAPVAQNWFKARRQNLKPWLLFLQSSKFQVPTSLPSLTTRIMANINNFQSNYLCIFIILIFYCLLTSPLLFIALGGTLGACHLVSKRNSEKKLILLGHEMNLAQQYGLVALVSFPLFYLAGAGAAVFWVLGASVFLIVLHATFYNGDLSVDESFGLPVHNI